MKDALKNLLHSGIEFAITTTEKIQRLMDEAIVYGKEFQEQLREDDQEAKEEKAEASAAKSEEKAEKTEEVGEEKADDAQSRFEELEIKVRRWIDTAISRFGFIRNDDHEKIADRIAGLEEKLSKLAKDAADQSGDTNSSRV